MILHFRWGCRRALHHLVLHGGMRRATEGTGENLGDQLLPPPLLFFRAAPGPGRILLLLSVHQKQDLWGMEITIPCVGMALKLKCGVLFLDNFVLLLAWLAIWVAA